MRLTCASTLVAISLTLVSGQQPASSDPHDASEARVKNGREYRKAPTGRVSLPTTVRGVTLDNVLDVPGDYDPSRRWPLRVSLHGGVGRAAPGPNDPPARVVTNRTVISGELVLHPRAWSGLEWWTAAQVENIERLVDRVKRDYNVDESRIYVTGISDGGTGVYYLAMRAATLWAACLPLNGHPLVLANPDSGADGMLFSSNLANCALRVVNGGRDPLYPAASVAPMIAMFRRGGIPVDFQVYPDAGHDVSWWPQERPGYEAFLAAHRRVPHPERISWATERTDRYNRFRWLVIDRLGARGSDRPIADVNRFAAGNGREQPLFPRGRQSGQVDVTRRGNTFEAETRGVTAFTLLLSPDVIDFAKPVRVLVNGRIAYDGTVARNRDTLQTWAARDNDRTMLYAAELRVSVP